mmetsp:Transcript_40485/g.130091  ORF Transcript_40485/g.130091 Transcript_40485/m.130091 type:complete len:406 (+) Transcript_40485:701-1918(+)
MRPAARGIHLRGGDVPLLLALVQRRHQLLGSRHDLLLHSLHVHHATAQVFLHLQADLRRLAVFRRGRFVGEQIQDVLLVDLYHVGLHLERLASRSLLLHDVEEALDGARGKARLLWGAIHRVSLARTGLAVRENRDVVAVDGALHELPAVREDLLLGAVAVEDRVETEGPNVGVRRRARDLNRHGVYAAQRGRLAVLAGDHGPEAAEDTDHTLHVLDLVVVLLPKLLLLRKLLLQCPQLRIQSFDSRLHLPAPLLGLVAAPAAGLGLGLERTGGLRSLQLRFLELGLELEQVGGAPVVQLLALRGEPLHLVFRLVQGVAEDGGQLLMLLQLLPGDLRFLASACLLSLQPSKLGVQWRQQILRGSLAQAHVVLQAELLDGPPQLPELIGGGPRLLLATSEALHFAL